MKKAQETNTKPVVYRRDNEYVMSRRDMSTPYFASYCAARAQRPSPNSVKMRSVMSVPPRAEAGYYDDYVEAVPERKAPPARKASSRRTAGSSKPARRAFFVLLIVIFTLLYIAVAALNYLNLDALSDYSEYFSLFNKTEGDTVVYIGVEDIVMSVAGMFVDSIDTSGCVFYNECLANIDSADTMNMIAYYALPVVLVLGVLIAVIFFIRALVALFTAKRRKLFIFSSVLMLLLSIAGIVCGFIWGGADWSEIAGFISYGGTLPMQVGYGYVILAGLSLLSLIASFFAFRSKKRLA